MLLQGDLHTEAQARVWLLPSVHVTGSSSLPPPGLSFLVCEVGR